MQLTTERVKITAITARSLTDATLYTASDLLIALDNPEFLTTNNITFTDLKNDLKTLLEHWFQQSHQQNQIRHTLYQELYQQQRTHAFTRYL